jgi:hypothetical protein
MAPRLELWVTPGPSILKINQDKQASHLQGIWHFGAEMSRALRRYRASDWEVPAGGWEE